jgi:hypothetical protein
MEIDMTKPRCQSCGMPLMDGGYGTEADGSPSSMYCKFCYQSGAFTQPDMTLEKMIEASVGYMTNNMGIPEAEARPATTKVLATLKRWKV